MRLVIELLMFTILTFISITLTEKSEHYILLKGSHKGVVTWYIHTEYVRIQVCVRLWGGDSRFQVCSRYDMNSTNANIVGIETIMRPMLPNFHHNSSTVKMSW